MVTPNEAAPPVGVNDSIADGDGPALPTVVPPDTDKPSAAPAKTSDAAPVKRQHSEIWEKLGLREFKFTEVRLFPFYDGGCSTKVAWYWLAIQIAAYFYVSVRLLGLNSTHSACQTGVHCGRDQHRVPAQPGHQGVSSLRLTVPDRGTWWCSKPRSSIARVLWQFILELFMAWADFKTARAIRDSANISDSFTNREVRSVTSITAHSARLSIQQCYRYYSMRDYNTFCFYRKVASVVHTRALSALCW